MKIKTIIFAIAILFFTNSAHAVEGMWLPILLKKYNIEEMQQKGFKLTAEDIYDINQASIKDAIVGLVRLSNPFHHFCTGEIISPDGLVLTNHHCGYGAIQHHSSVENDFLKDGFWAMNRSEELTNEGIGVCLLKRMQDVTDSVLMNIPANADESQRDSIIEANISKIEKNAVKDTDYLAKVKSFYGGNEYYLSVYEIFRDLRLVGAPPSAIGKFGGDTDNWMWPRHTGDFSLFRIYTDSTNNSADISQENIPYQPLHHLKISTSGVKKGDFTMVMGYPGTTEEYLPSFAVSMRMNLTNPARISVRNDAINIMKSGMNSSPTVRIQYSAKVASKANGWKKWIGENRGLKRLNAITVKQEQERLFNEWVSQDSNRVKEYGHVIKEYEKLYTDLEEYQLAYTYFVESLMGAELISFARNFSELLSFNKETNDSTINAQIARIKSTSERFFKNYHKETDKKLFTTLLSHYYKNLDQKYQPEIFTPILSKYKGDYEVYFSELFDNSLLNNQEALNEFIDNYKISSNKKLTKDPVVQIFSQAIDIYYSQIRPSILSIKTDISSLHQTYIHGLRIFDTTKTYYPDANSTFRIAYGNIDNYSPRDAVKYYHSTTLGGIMEKDNPDIFDYDVPQKLRDLYAEQNFGDYANSDGTMPVCFTASNHTTGGNSGSPVINGKGELIGINFDRNWEGTMSDLMYDPDMCRNIALDIRYVLFLIDKFAGAKHIINELSLVNNVDQTESIEATVE